MAGSISFVLLTLWAQDPPRPYRLESVDLKQNLIWGAECRRPDGTGLSFGGQDQDADDGRPHTRILVDGVWTPIHRELRKRNGLQPFHVRAWDLRTRLKNIRARARHLYFEGRPYETETGPQRSGFSEDLNALRLALEEAGADAYEKGQAAFARKLLSSITPGPSLKAMREAQVALEQAAEALDAEPPPRAMECGNPRRKEKSERRGKTLVYVEKAGIYVVFGGDHLDYLTNDTWVFDAARRRWFQRHPEGAPPPRANHELETLEDGTLRMTGGYTYSSNTDYVGGQYVDLRDGPWEYDVEENRWSGGPLVTPLSRTYRTGPFHPDFYLQGPRPDASAFDAWLADLPENRWAATNPPYRPRLNRDWGCARIDPDRDLMLRWSGGHSAHGGTDVPHYHFATNRWELAFPVEFPLGQLYSNTRYPRGFNFNLRPWMTGHTYQNYALDPPSGRMVKAGRPHHFYLYDPDAADWVQRGEKPKAMSYGSCFYDLTLVATPKGAVCWDKNGRVHRFDGRAGRWEEIALSGDTLPGSRVDSSTLAFDSKRDRVLVIRKDYGKPPYDGQIYAIDLKSGRVQALSPAGMTNAHRFAYVDRCCYDAANDLVLMASYLSDAGDRTRTPAYDCAGNRWITLDLDYDLGRRGRRITRLFPHGRSCGLMFDAKRKLIWGTDTNSQVYVLRMNPKTAEPRLLGE